MCPTELDQTTYFVSDTKASHQIYQFSCGVLTVFNGSDPSIEINLARFNKEIISFGRSPENDIVLDSPYVSRKHGQFRRINDSWAIDDLNSTNKLIFNNSSIDFKVLESGDSIRIDDGIETTKDGVLFIFSKDQDSSHWQMLTLETSQLVTLGRDRNCDVVLDHISVSRVHAKIIADTNGFYLIDNNSTNGVVVNGKRISGKHYLHEKDIILITNTEVIYGNGRLTWRVFRGGIRVESEGITKTVGKSKKVICDKVSFTIEPCELVAIIGGSGAGKSTVMNCISGYSQPTSGIVRVNNYDLYGNFEAFKHLIGFVPQQDIVFENLTVHDMLIYAAQLRLPTDTNATERLAIVDQVIDTVGLTDRRSTLIKQLSGGQKKRASIAVELLSNPRLFFLDEPTSGLDPGIERELIMTLRSMVDSGKTVIFVTHSTLNLHLCDKVIVMGAGGKLCFCGGYDDFLEFFEVSDIVDVYNLINDDSSYWESKYSQTRHDNPIASPIANTVVAKHRVRHDTIRQTLILTKRNLHVLLNDRVRSIILILQAPLLVWLISVVADGKQFEQYEMTKSLLFALSCSAFWVGLLNSIQEICKERNILRREYMTGLRLDAYVLSKSVAMGLICVIQSFLLTTGFALLVGMPKEGIIGSSAYLEVLLVTFLTALAASSTGILVSALFKNADRAMAIAPVLLIPQLLFSGLIFTLDGPSKIISWVAACRFSMEAYGSIANLNTLALRIEEQGIIVPHNAEAFYEYTVEHFFFAIGVLLIFIPVYCIMAGLVLRNIKKSQD